MKKVLFAAASATILVLGCQTIDDEFTDAEMAATEAEIGIAFESIVNTDDPAVLLSHFAEDIVSVSNTTLNPPMTQEMKDAVMEYYGSSPKSKVDFSKKHVVALTKDIGYAVGAGTGTVIDPSGAALSSFDITLSTVWTRTEEGWRAVSTHQTIKEHSSEN